MPHPNFTILYVDSPEKSGAFYASLLGCEPVEASPTFVLFALETGLMLGLWSRHTVEPIAALGGGGGEIAFALGEPGEVDALHEAWADKGLIIVQKPTDMDFGRAFMALDPDGHRLRVFAPAAS
jgi:catechol 2,3-dioxygenase-like lactoylglutathione lyase family enzyme